VQDEFIRHSLLVEQGEVSAFLELLGRVREKVRLGRTALLRKRSAEAAPGLPASSDARSVQEIVAGLL